MSNKKTSKKLKNLVGGQNFILISRGKACINEFVYAFSLTSYDAI